jgi:hypothetical protein
MFLISGAKMAPAKSMMASLIREPTDGRTRQNLRLKPEIWTAIDTACANRGSGKIPRNTWIAEAISEKLAREKQSESGGRGA